MSLRIEFKNITKRYGAGDPAVDGVSLAVEPGEFLTLLGPSGCGKTTMLRCLAGLEVPDAGSITIGDRVVSDAERGIFAAPSRRGLGLVFQSYALWPHMTVEQNVAFGLEVQGLKRAEVRERVAAALAEMRLPGLEKRYPGELSGGQQQRVALARMLAARPAVFLLDEPLSNLDARLRTDMRAELKHLHHTTGATTLYVTHDQLEALTMSTRIAVLNRGRLQQVAPPGEVYRSPTNLFVADFIGYPKINLVDARADGQVLRFGPFELEAGGRPLPARVVVAARPEDLEILDGPAPGAAEFKVYAALPAGAEQIVDARAGDLSLTVRQIHGRPLRTGEAVWLRVPLDRINLYDADTGDLLLAGSAAPAAPLAT
jgi:multiple sugar transport system ATP-binding protein